MLLWNLVWVFSKAGQNFCNETPNLLRLGFLYKLKTHIKFAETFITIHESVGVGWAELQVSLHWVILSSVSHVQDSGLLQNQEKLGNLGKEDASPCKEKLEDKLLKSLGIDATEFFMSLLFNFHPL